MLLEQLDTELKNHKANSIKESIRYFKSDNFVFIVIKNNFFNSTNKVMSFHWPNWLGYLLLIYALLPSTLTPILGWHRSISKKS